MTLAMVDGLVKGQFILGQNPVVGAVNSDLIERGLAQLEWLVVRDFAMIETADFWQKGRLAQRGELKPVDIGTEIFFLPSAMPGEKDGTSPTPAGLCSGTTRCWNRLATTAPTFGSSTISASG